MKSACVFFLQASKSDLKTKSFSREVATEVLKILHGVDVVLFIVVEGHTTNHVVQELPVHRETKRQVEQVLSVHTLPVRLERQGTDLLMRHGNNESVLLQGSPLYMWWNDVWRKIVFFEEVGLHHLRNRHVKYVKTLFASVSQRPAMHARAR